MKPIVRAMPVLAALLLLAACGEPSSPDVLNARVTEQMAPDQPCNKPASIEYLPDGARISMPESALFTVGRADFSACGRYAMASAVEAMLDPGIMQVIIEPSGDIEAPYAGLARQRAGTLRGLFIKTGFVPYQPQPIVLVQSRSPTPIGVWGIVLLVAGRS
jgi:hypothetical protein